MAPPKETLWTADPHTLAKHDVLRRYLQAWFPILSRYNSRVVYYDLFSGPGRYLGGEPGSPIIALEAALHQRTPITSNVEFVFIEERQDRADYLNGQIQRLSLPSNFCPVVYHGAYQTVLQDTFARLDASGQQIETTFAFIDPFGIDIPFDMVSRLLRGERCEVLITFMHSFIQRFVNDHHEQVNVLIGDPEAGQQIGAFPAAADRLICARRLYSESLRRCVPFVRFFEMRDDTDRPIYDLFFASSHRLGHTKMKEAMWALDTTGRFSFSDGVDPAQATLFAPEPEKEYARRLWSQYRGQTVRSEEVLAYTSDGTAYLEKHARAALQLLEAPGGFQNHRIEVDGIKIDGSRRKRNTYPDGTQITFIDE